MKLYIANGTYVGTQADAKAITKQFTEVDVPTDKAGLIAYLNHVTKPLPDAEPDDQFETVVERQDPAFIERATPTAKPLPDAEARATFASWEDNVADDDEDTDPFS